MTKAIYDRLIAAKGTGEILAIVYNGGSQPGTKRLVIPIQVNRDEIRAREVATNAIKAFRLEKIVMVTEGINADAIPDGWKQAAPPISTADPVSIPDAITPHLSELESLGWCVDLTPDRCRLFYASRVAKTGRVYAPKLGVELEFREFIGETILDAETSEFREVIRRSSKPYVTGSRAFALLGKATLLFLEQARAAAPKKA